MDDHVYQKLLKCYEAIESRIPFTPKVALVLGSGLGGFADEIEEDSEILYRGIPGFPVSTVPGHEGKFIFGHVGSVPVVCMKGRVHYYEGYDITDVVLPARLMHLMGAEILFLTNAAGGINRNFTAGDFMLIRDQISSFVPSPLIGPNPDALGERFPDMSRIYDPVLCDVIRQAAAGLDITLQEGVYLQFTGPAYESPAEVRMAGILGADAVGMSTAVEAVAARHMNMRVCGISFISNAAAGLLGPDQTLSHEEVKARADEAAPYFNALVRESIKRMGEA